MTLEDAFGGMLTSNVKGLHKYLEGINKVSGEIRQLTEAGDLAAVKTKLADLRGKIGKLDSLLNTAETRTTQLTKDEQGNILDLSVPPANRK